MCARNLRVPVPLSELEVGEGIADRRLGLYRRGRLVARCVAPVIEDRPE